MSATTPTTTPTTTLTTTPTTTPTTTSATAAAPPAAAAQPDCEPQSTPTQLPEEAHASKPMEAASAALHALHDAIERRAPDVAAALLDANRSLKHVRALAARGQPPKRVSRMRIKDAVRGTIDAAARWREARGGARVLNMKHALTAAVLELEGLTRGVERRALRRHTRGVRRWAAREEIAATRGRVALLINDAAQLWGVREQLSDAELRALAPWADCAAPFVERVRVACSHVIDVLTLFANAAA